MTAMVSRTMWKYEHSHAYRVLLLDAGHLGQTFHLACTALGLGPLTTAAINGLDVEEALGLDGIKEIVMYAAATGLPRLSNGNEDLAANLGKKRNSRAVVGDRKPRER
jgi:SagB-type dehydrogenase family enzyme